MKKKTAQKKLVLTDEEKKKIVEAMYSTWQYIGSDAMQVEAENGHNSISASDMVGWVTDGGYMQDKNAMKIIDRVFDHYAGYNKALAYLAKLLPAKRYS